MKCKQLVKDDNGIWRKCKSNAKILGLCTNHFTMVKYGKKVFHRSLRELHN